MMNTDMKKHVVHLLDTYHKRARQIAVLRYELSDPVKITEEEMIDTLQFAHREGAGHTEGHISNKTPYIALNYREKADLLNAETLSEIALTTSILLVGDAEHANRVFIHVNEIIITVFLRTAQPQLVQRLIDRTDVVILIPFQQLAKSNFLHFPDDRRILSGR